MFLCVTNMVKTQIQIILNYINEVLSYNNYIMKYQTIRRVFLNFHDIYLYQLYCNALQLCSQNILMKQKFATKENEQ